MPIVYPEGKTLELWVRDVGVFEGFALFVNGKLVDEIGDQIARKYPIDRPKNSAAVVIHFGGADGGISAIVDVTDASAKTKIEAQTGVKHSYLISKG